MSDINRPLRGFRLVQIQNGDTLQKIAAREVGDANVWRDLININKLTYPYLTGDPTAASATVKMYGQMIAVPAASVQISSELDPDLVFKTDIDLTGGNLSDNGAGDLLTISGVANYKQAISNRLATEQKELIFHLAYGCALRALLGTVNGPTAATLAAQYVKAAVQADPRTASVKSSTATVVGDALVVNAVAIPVNGAPVGVTQSIPI
jgi:phage baseplate assembly protein W